MIDLWREDIGLMTPKAPVAVLQEQAALLGQKTQNVVQAKVSPQRGGGISSFSYSFNIVAVGVGAYTYRLFTIYHDIELYPVEFYLDGEIAREILGISDETKTVIKVESEEALIKLLGKVLKAKKTVRIINALLSQADYLGEPVLS